ncbi:fumarylacetoacetate hydrolase family protein [Cohnella sp. GCM10027633]|uniref:fumarylacetoacetate hydrolase family protein n=1 Tax=unclassified Cohnella TaxID=2636738 RepID=UPI00363AD8AA
MDIRNIYCVGRNYRLHAEELGNEVPTTPMLFTKPTHAIAAMDGGKLIIPADQGAVHFEAELVFAVGRAYEPGMRCDELFTHYTVGLDLTLRDVQDTIKKKGLPWLPAKGFRHSAVLGEWRAYPGLDAVAAHPFGLRINGAEAQRGEMKDMVFGLQTLVDFIGRAYGLGPGDLIYTGTPAGVDALREGDDLEIWWNEEALGRATVKMED